MFTQTTIVIHTAQGTIYHPAERHVLNYLNGQTILYTQRGDNIAVTISHRHIPPYSITVDIILWYYSQNKLTISSVDPFMYTIHRYFATIYTFYITIV